MFAWLNRNFNRRGVLFRIIVPVAFTLLLGIILQLIFLRSEMKETLIQSSTRIAKSNIEQFKTLRGYYTEKVISKVKAAGNIEVSFNQAAAIEEAVPG